MAQLFTNIFIFCGSLELQAQLLPDRAMRDTKDLLRELDEAVPKHQHVVRAVAFDSGNAILVWPDDPERLRHLDEAVASSGIPLGLIAIDYAEREKDHQHAGLPGIPRGRTHSR